MIQEITRKCASGYLALVVIPALHILDGWLIYKAFMAESPLGVFLAVLAFVIIVICYKGFFMVHPNQAKVLQLFGSYVGSARETGLRWANPFYSKEVVSLRVRNFESEVLKVNDDLEDAEKIAAELEKLLPRDEWITFSTRMILHGRRVCSARSPRCGECVLAEICPRVGVER